MKDQLTDVQIAKIEQFCNDEEMYNAVRAVMLAGIYSHGTVKRGYVHDPLQNGALRLARLAVNNPIPDDILGAHIRGVWEGLNSLENAFQSLRSIKKEPEPVESPYNEAQ